MPQEHPLLRTPTEGQRMTLGPGGGDSPSSYWAVALGLLLLYLSLGCGVAHAQIDKGSTGWIRGNAASGSGGSGDVEAVNITSTSPITGGANCASGTCAFTLGLTTITTTLGGLGLNASASSGFPKFTAGSVAIGALVAADIPTPTVVNGSGSTSTVSSAITHDGMVWSDGAASDKVTLEASPTPGVIRRFALDGAGAGPFQIAPGSGQTIWLGGTSAAQGSAQCFQFSARGSLSVQAKTSSVWIVIGTTGTATVGSGCS